MERADLVKTEDMDATLFHGFYPRIHKMDIEPEMFFLRIFTLMLSVMYDR